MMGIKGPGRRVEEGEIRRLWSDSATGRDLRRIGIEAPEQLGALFLMDGEEIDRITAGIAPLTDFYPKRPVRCTVGRAGEPPLCLQPIMLVASLRDSALPGLSDDRQDLAADA